MLNNYHLVNNVFNRLDDVLDQLSVISTLCTNFNFDKIHERSAIAHITDAEKWLSIALSELRASLHDYEFPELSKD